MEPLQLLLCYLSSRQLDWDISSNIPNSTNGSTQPSLFYYWWQRSRWDLNFPVYVDLGTWHIIIFVYILIASVAPVWALLQPRDYLNSYLLIFMIVGAVIGVFAANPACNLKPFTSFNVNGQYMFPILFVTIACGAVSGFHSLVSSGTASKQIKNEKNMLPVSFGAMLMESMLAIIALIAVASFADGEAAAQGLTTQPQILQARSQTFFP